MQLFAAIYNDPEAYPTVWDVAEELGISERTARRWASRIRQTPDTGINLITRGDYVLSQPAAPAPIKEPVDAVKLRRTEDEVARLRAQRRDDLRTIGELEDIRSGILGLLDPPLEPRMVVNRSSRPSGQRSVVLFLSDLHYGETVDIREMDGVNAYSEAIAQARIARYFDKVTSLMTRHWTGAPPVEVIVCLGGDLISGDIHPELKETNAPAVPATVKGVAESIAGGLLSLRRAVGVPMRVYSVPGNHGRLTMKPQSKRRAALSLDLLAADFIEMMVKAAGINDVTFFQTHSPDAYFSTFAYNWLLNHGDTMGSRGGQGFIGSSATIIRGHRKLMDTTMRQGRMVHYLLTGHLHTTLRTPFGWSNGSMVGYGEYARDLRADPEPAKQWMLTVHDREGVIDEKEIYLGAPEEGSHYLGPASFIRPDPTAL